MLGQCWSCTSTVVGPPSDTEATSGCLYWNDYTTAAFPKYIRFTSRIATWYSKLSAVGDVDIRRGYGWWGSGLQAVFQSYLCLAPNTGCWIVSPADSVTGLAPMHLRSHWWSYRWWTFAPAGLLTSITPCRFASLESAKDSRWFSSPFRHMNTDAPDGWLLVGHPHITLVLDLIIRLYIGSIDSSFD